MSPATLFDPAWRARLEARACEAPARPRRPLAAGADASAIGSLEPLLAERMLADGLPLRPLASGGWHLEGPVDAALQRLAEWLRDRRLASRWRGELLDVRAPAGGCLGRVERSAMRALGLATHAVHLVGRDAHGVWVQQRALDKSIDPGRWDTLVGGLVAAGETIGQTLQRESEEEAGLAVAVLADLRHADHLEVRRPVDDGYLIEVVDVFEADLPAGTVPVNRDGEVARFERLGPRPLAAALEAEAFTLEASWILARALERAR